MAQQRTSVENSPLGIPVRVVILAVVAAIGVGAFILLEHSSKRAVAPTLILTPEAKQYVAKLGLSDVEMKAHESYLKQSIVEIVGKIQNKGDRTLKDVKINCVFYDPYGQLVLRETVAIVTPKMGGLSPGETKQFRLPFDNIPESWNQAMPQLVIAQIVFQ